MEKFKIWEHKSTTKFYDAKPILSLDKKISIVMGGRDNGKSYAFVKTLSLKSIKEGFAVCLVRRTDKDVKKVVSSLIKILTAEFPKKKIKKWGDEILINGKRAFILVGLTASSSFKSTEILGYNDVKYTIFDEFIPEPLDYVRKDEATQFNSLMSTIERLDTWKRFILVGNSITKQCPMLEKFLYGYELPYKSGYIYEYKNVAIEFAETSKEIKEIIKNSAFGEMARRDERYLKYALGVDAFVNDNDYAIIPTYKLDILEWKFTLYVDFENMALDVAETLYNGKYHICESKRNNESILDEYGENAIISASRGATIISDEWMLFFINKLNNHQITFSTSIVRTAFINSLNKWFKFKHPKDYLVWKIK